MKRQSKIEKIEEKTLLDKLFTTKSMVTIYSLISIIGGLFMITYTHYIYQDYVTLMQYLDYQVELLNYTILIFSGICIAMSYIIVSFKLEEHK